MNTNTMNNDVNNSRQSHFAFIAGVVSALAVVAIIGFAFCVGMWFAGKKERNNDKEKIGAIQRDIHDAYDKVQLWEGGPYWATTNIGAEKPEDYGYYFWWGDTVGYKPENGKWVASDGSNSNFSFSSNTTPTYNKGISTLQSEGWIVSKDGTYVLTPEHDAAQVQWGGDWRMPTDQELYDLCYNKCDWSWDSRNGVYGYIVRGRGSYASNSIFLPCAGNGNRIWLDNVGSNGHYWSSAPDADDNTSWIFFFGSGYHNMGDFYRNCGLPVRPVQGFAK